MYPEGVAIALEAAKTPWQMSKDGKNRFRKELIYVGDFTIPREGEEPLRFSVDKAMLDHWVTTFAEMKADGIDVPAPKEHTTDPELRRGTMVDIELAINDKGLDAVFGIFEFKDESAEQLAKSTNVSVFVPPVFEQNDKTYVRPIRHVALTDYPAIPGLEKFEAVAASLVPFKEPIEMSVMSDLAGKLGINVEDEDKAAGLIVETVKSLRTKITELEKAVKENPPKKKEEDRPKIAASLLTLGRESRQHKLAALVDAGKILPAVKDKLAIQYCSDETIAASLADGAAPDGFDATIAALCENDAVISLSEKTGAQVLKDEDNPLLKDAENRKEPAVL